MQELASLTFTPDGSGHCLYHELFPLHKLGRLQCVRASHLEFNPETQAWEVRVPEADEIVFSSSSRRTCLEWERRHLEPIRKESSHASATRSAQRQCLPV